MESDETLGIPTYLSLCSGYDGIGLGLKRVIPNLRTIAHVEIEAYAIANLISKMEAGQMDACPVFSDLKQFPFEQVRGRVGILSAGFPCQPFSSAGKRRATEDPRHIYPSIADGISICRPRYVFLENVQGIISAKTGDGESVLKYVLGDLEQRGYEVAAGVFSAEEVGAPHQRKRVFILGRLSDSANFGFGGTLPIEDREGEGRNDACGEGATEGMGATELGNPSSERPRGGSENCAREQSEVLGERLESDELGNAKHDGSSTAQDRRSACAEQEEGRMQELEGGREQSEDELADRKHKRLGGRPASGSGGVDGEGSEIAEEGQEGDGLRCETEGCGGESRELANPASGQSGESQARNGRQDIGGGSEEELVNPVGGRFEQRESECEKEDFVGEGGQPTRWPARPGEEQYEWEEPRVTEAQSEFCGSAHAGQGHDGVDATAEGVDAIVNRVDRLRLLGNGVVPACAELAWRTLWKELNEKERN